jgi:cell division protein FtsB
MGGMQLLLEVVLLGLLAATLFHAMRLERALGVLKRDRATLEALVSSFNESTRQAEGGVARLRETADGAGRQIARQIEAAGALKGDLVFLAERGEKLADRMDTLVRHGRVITESARARPAIPEPPGADRVPATNSEPDTRMRSQAERDLMRALKLAR